MSWLEREIKRKLEEVTEVILRGDALDYTAYASAVARYRALKELVDDLAEHRQDVAAGEPEVDD